MKYIVKKEFDNLKIGDIVDIENIYTFSTYGFDGKIYTDGEYRINKIQFDKEKLDQYLTPLADWREQQIKSILD